MKETHKTYITKNCFLKVFSINAKDEEYNYHLDPNSRLIKVLEGTGWSIKFKNRTAKQIGPGSVIHISKRVIHKLIKGTSNLKVQVLEL
jgi:hypothetical protein